MIEDFSTQFNQLYLLMKYLAIISRHPVYVYIYLAESITINYIACNDSHKLEIISIMISLLNVENLLS